MMRRAITNGFRPTSTQALKSFNDMPTPPGSWVPYVGKEDKIQGMQSKTHPIFCTFSRKHSPIDQETRWFWQDVDELEDIKRHWPCETRRKSGSHPLEIVQSCHWKGGLSV